MWLALEKLFICRPHCASGLCYKYIQQTQYAFSTITIPKISKWDILGNTYVYTVHTYMCAEQPGMQSKLQSEKKENIDAVLK